MTSSDTKGMWADNEDVYMTDPAPAGRNAMVTGYCPAITAALRSSHNLEFNGFGHQLRSTLYYLTKYFSKDPHPFVNTLSLALAAVEHIDQYPSRAEDRGTPQRTARYFLQNMINRRCAVQEVSAVMAAAALLELPSFDCSADFWFVYASPAVHRVKIAHAQHPPPAAPPFVDHDQDPLLLDEGLSQAEEEQVPVLESALDDPEAVLHDYESIQGRDAVEEVPELKIDLDAGGGAIVGLTQDIDYRWRGELQPMCLYEYGGIVRRVALTEQQLAELSVPQLQRREQGLRDPGRRANRVILFDEGYPGRQRFGQRLKSKPSVPFVAGGPFPLHPGRFPRVERESRR